MSGSLSVTYANPLQRGWFQLETNSFAMASLCQVDPLLSRAHELVSKGGPMEGDSLWLKPPSCAQPPKSKAYFWHPWYPEHQLLLAGGWEPLQEGEAWSTIVVYGGKQKEETLHLLRFAASQLKESGQVLFAVPNEYGSKSYQKPLAGIFRQCDYDSGRKSRLYRLREPQIQSKLELCQLQQVHPPYWSGPGLFSWQKPDRGSIVLAEVLDGLQLKQPVADLGAGWGYLASRLPRETKLHLYEADSRGVSACRKNLDGPVEVFWSDVTDLPTETTYGTVITNPPFHTGKRSEPILGGAFAATAHKILKPGGQLLLVGNAHLPYPKIVKSIFGDSEVLVRKDGFAVVRARKS